jgi:pimeloyl-ACP methyl ester carboxylesterase
VQFSLPGHASREAEVLRPAARRTRADRRTILWQLSTSLKGPGEAISRPCLVIWFQEDIVVRPHLCREVATSTPGSVYTEIPGCGHYGYLEQPAAVNTALIDFFGCRQP